MKTVAIMMEHVGAIRAQTMEHVKATRAQVLATRALMFATRAVMGYVIMAMIEA